MTTRIALAMWMPYKIVLLTGVRNEIREEGPMSEERGL